LKSAKRKIKLKRDVRAYLDALAEELAENYHPEGTPLETAWSIYIAQPGERDKTARTLESKKLIWKAFLRWCEKNKIRSIQEIGRKEAANYASFLVAPKIEEEGKPPKTISAQTFNNHRHSLHSVFKLLALPCGLSENPFEHIRPRAAVHKSYQPFKPNEIWDILKASPDRWSAPVVLALYSGMRLEDVCFLKWDEVDLEKGIIDIMPHKTARFLKELKIPIHPELDSLLRNHPRAGEYVFPWMAKEYKRREFKLEFGKLLKSLNLKDGKKVGFHSLRHTCATWMAETGARREVVQKLLGHGSPMVTEIYSHEVGPQREAVGRLPRLEEIDPAREAVSKLPRLKDI
jgi:integrase